MWSTRILDYQSGLGCRVMVYLILTKYKYRTFLEKTFFCRRPTVHLRVMANKSNILEGKLSLVTGGGSGIGRAICQVFAREGATVIVADVNESSGQDTVRQLPGNNNHKAFVVDVSESDSVTKLFQDIHQMYKRSPVVLVNCAGILGRRALLVDCLDSDFDNVLKVNLNGTFLVTRAAIKGMLDENLSNGSVINLASIVAKVGMPASSIYAASKAGVLAFTKSVAQEVADKGIRCNALMPGAINTPLFHGGGLESVFETLIPMKRLGNPEEVAEVCAFLASDRSSYMTGAGIEVTGGEFT